MSNSMRSNRGFSLVELMIAMVAGLIVTGAVVAFTLSSLKGNSDYVLSTRLTQELRNTLDLVTRDLRRAGYDDDALSYLGNNNASPFSPLRVETATESDGSQSSCVIYAYDRTYPNGSLTASFTAGGLDVGNGEIRGIRRKLVTVNGRLVGVIEYAASTGAYQPACADATADYSGNPPSCDPASGQLWCTLSDARNLDITRFTIVNNFKDLGTVANGRMRQRTLDVGIVGRPAGTTEYTRDVQSRVKVRTDCTRSDFSACNNAAPTP